MKPLLLSVFVLFLLSSPAFAQPTVAVRLSVLDQQSQFKARGDEFPIPGATVTFTDEKGNTYVGKTDSGGVYFTYSLPEVNYKISITANGYPPYSDKEFRDLGFQIAIYMRKIGETGRPEKTEEEKAADQAALDKWYKDMKALNTASPDTWAIKPELSSEILSPDEEQAVIDAIIEDMPARFEQRPQERALDRVYWWMGDLDRKLIDRLLKQRIAERTLRAGIDEAEKKKIGKPAPGAFKELDPKQDWLAIYTLWYDDVKWIVEHSPDPAMTPEERAKWKVWFKTDVSPPERFKKSNEAEKAEASSPGAEVGWQNKIADRYMMADLWSDKRLDLGGWPVLYPCIIKRCNFRYIDFPRFFIDGKIEKVPGLVLENYFDTAAESDLPVNTNPGEIFGLGWRQLQIKTPVWNYAYFPEMYRKTPFCPSRQVGRFGYPGDCPAAKAQGVPNDAPPEFNCERKEGKGNCQQLPGAPFLWLAKSCAPGYSYFTWQVPPKRGEFRVPVCAKEKNLTSFPGLSDLRPFPAERL